MYIVKLSDSNIDLSDMGGVMYSTVSVVGK